MFFARVARSAALKPLAQRSYVLRGEGTIALVAQAQALERQGRDIVHMEVGDPDFWTPPHVVEAAMESLRKGETHYQAIPIINSWPCVAIMHDQQNWL